MIIDRLTVIGVGLIGGSLAQALREAGEVGEVVGCDLNIDNLQRAMDLRVIDRFSTNVGEAVQGADVVFLAVPLGAMRSTFEAMKGHLKPGAVLTDGGSAKGSVVEDCRAAFGEIPPGLIPGHPIAGTENSGVDAAFKELYQNRRIIITPVEGGDPQALELVCKMWRACGAKVTEMAVEHHDEVLAATSHLPHMLAFGLVDTLARMEENEEVFRYAAGGFRDFTRIASSNPVMWRDVCVANRQALGDIMEHYIEEMSELAKIIRDGDSDQLFEIFSRAKSARDRYVDSVLNSKE